MEMPLILEDGKNDLSLASLLRKLWIGCWITRIADWSKESTWASLLSRWLLVIMADYWTARLITGRL